MRRVLLLTLLALVASLVGTSRAHASAAISSPKAGSTVAGVVGVVSRSGATDDITRVDLTVDGVVTGSAWAAPWGVLWDTRSVADGTHTLRMNTISSTGATVSSTPVKLTVHNGASGGLAATYFRKRDLTSIALARTDAAVDFDWGKQAPAASVRWAGTLEVPATDIYTFDVQAQGGVRLWLGPKLLVDAWGERGASDHTATVSLTAAQQHGLTLEYVDNGGPAASVHLRWKSFHSGLTTIPARLLRPKVGASSRTYGFRAAFYEGRGLSTSRLRAAKYPVASRVDQVLDFHWGTGKPDVAVPANDYTAVWAGTITPPRAGTYTFTTKADDGVRLYVGNTRVISDWNIHPARTSSGKVKLRKGVPYAIRLEYFQGGGESELALAWTPPKGKRALIPARYVRPAAAPPERPKIITGLTGTYYGDDHFGAEVLRRLDNQLEFGWDGGSPDPSIAPDHFSVRWTGSISVPTSGQYTLATHSDDGVRLFVDGQIVLDDWHIHGRTWNRVALDLQAGRPYDIELQYYEGYGGAAMRFGWIPPGGRFATIPTQFLQPHDPLGAPMQRQPLPAPATAQPGLWGVYYDDEDLSGAMVGRVDPQLAFHWKGDRPHPSIGADTFSAAWTGTVAVPLADDYTFISEADDGVRVWVDGRLLVDRWKWDGRGLDRSSPIHLEPGRRYDLRVEQHDSGGASSMELRWSSARMPEQPVPTWALMTPGPADATVTVPPPPAQLGAPPATPVAGLWGAYYDDAAFKTPTFTRTDPGVAFDFARSSPDPRLGADTFSIRWLGTVQVPTSGAWQFHVRADDGVRLWVCDKLVVDQWREQGATEYTSPSIALVAGTPCAIRVDYYENGGDASVRLQWSSATQTKQTVPASALRTPDPATLAPYWWW